MVTVAGFARTRSAGLSNLVAYVLFLILVPLIAHWRYSRLGFNPTDDGFVLAGSRRLLAGEFPHRDFISVHTIGSSILHLPFVLLGGDHVYLASRFFVWFEFAAIALTWTRLIGRLMGAAREPAVEIPIAAIAFVFSSHYFPMMAWPTIDGLLFAGLGLLLCTLRPKAARFVGYLLIGAAYGCKQSFAPLFPVALLLFGDWRRGYAWIAGGLPALAYFALLAIGGGLADATVQLGSHIDIGLVGIRKFLWEYATPWGVLSGYVAARVLYRRTVATGPGLDAAAAGLLIFLALGGACYALAGGRFLGAASFGLYGLALGAVLQSALDGEGFRGRGAAGMLVVAVAWCTSLSIGYNTPALASGLCAAYMLWLAHAAPAPRFLGGWRLPIPYLLLAVGAMACFDIARETYVYLDRPASELTYRLDGVLPGGAGLVTNENTYEVLNDLNLAVGKAGGGRYAILPDFAGYWVAAKALNPLPSDWPNWIELRRPELLARMLRQMDAQRQTVTFIVAKTDAFSLSRGFVTMTDSDRYAVATYVRHNYTKIDETRFFELYR